MENPNYPTTSDPLAMQMCPDARNNERDVLIDSVTIRPGDTILDIQSAAGYLSDEVYRRLDGNVTCICLEPSAKLRERLNPAYTIIDNPVENFYSLDDNSVDIVLGLAGLHHSESHKATVSECFRVLKPAGQLAICDAIEGTNITRWLNEFVDKNSACGHKGRFVHEGEVQSLYHEAGFVDIEYAVKNVPWLFYSRDEICKFFKGLFALNCSLETVNTALDDYLSLDVLNGAIIINWPLLYCTGRKPEKQVDFPR